MEKKILDRANELSKRLSEINSFIYTYKQTWKRGKLTIKKRKLFIGHLGYGFYASEEIEADKVLSEKIYLALLEYQEEIRKEFEELGKAI